MQSSPSQPRIIRRTVEQEKTRLRTFIGRMEHRYECSSEELLQLLDAGKMRETAEVVDWLHAWELLNDLNALGDTTGSRTMNIR